MRPMQQQLAYDALEIRVRVPVVRERRGVRVTSPPDVAFALHDIRHAGQELMVVLLLDADHHILRREIVGVGIQDAALVHPREVFRSAVLHNAGAIVLAHNHPAGKAEFSPADLKIARHLIKAGKILDIHVLDAVIVVPSGDTVSARASGLLIFDDSDSEQPAAKRPE